MTAKNAIRALVGAATLAVLGAWLWFSWSTALAALGGWVVCYLFVQATVREAYRKRGLPEPAVQASTDALLRGDPDALVLVNFVVQRPGAPQPRPLNPFPVPAPDSPHGPH